ncbi:MAG: S24 family peptidase [Pseudomonadota bacterium]
MFVTKAARQSADAAQIFDDLPMLNHSPSVQDVRTSVKGVETVPRFCDGAYMADKTTGEILLALKLRAGDIPLEEIAKAGGWKGKSGVQAYFNAGYEGPLGGTVALKLAKALEGRGSPPIKAEDVTSLAAVAPIANASEPVEYEGSSMYRMPRDLPIYGSALGAEHVVDGEAVELTTLNKAEVIERRERPPILNGKRDVYGLYVQGSSMDPAFDDGDLLVVQKTNAVSIGDFVVVYLRPTDDSDDGETARSVLIKRLVRRTAQYVELRQYQPDITFRIPKDDVLRIDKALRTRDLLQ